MCVERFDHFYFASLRDEAQANPRRRQHRNVHRSYHDPCQRLFNAIEPDSYIRPHRHASDPRSELLIAIFGTMALITFDDVGHIKRCHALTHDTSLPAACQAIEVPSQTWHTVVALGPGCVLLEVKAGPFDPDQPKDLAPWAPDENTPDVSAYLNRLKQAAKT